MNRPGAIAAVGAFATSLGVVVLKPFCTSDGVAGTAPFVAAVARVAPQLAPGTKILIHPPWRDDVVTALDAPGALPPGVSATVVLNPKHGDDPGRVVVVRDTGAPGLPSSIEARFDEATATVQDGVEVVFLTGASSTPASAKPAPARGGSLAASLLPDAIVEVTTSDGRRVRCGWDPQQRRHICPGLPDWMYVGEAAQQIGGRDTKCVWSHPTTGGTVETRFPHVDASKGLTLSVALSDSASMSGAPVTTVATLNGAAAARVATPIGTVGFTKAVIAPGPADAELVLAVTTTNDGARHFCWTLEEGTR